MAVLVIGDVPMRVRGGHHSTVGLDVRPGTGRYGAARELLRVSRAVMSSAARRRLWSRRQQTQLGGPRRKRRRWRPR